MFTGYQQCQSTEGQNGQLRCKASISWKLAPQYTLQCTIHRNSYAIPPLPSG